MTTRKPSDVPLTEADSEGKVSHERLARAVGGTAQWLAGVGVRDGDVVVLCAPNGTGYVIAWYAASSLGAVIIVVDPALADKEIAAQLRRTGARWLVTIDGLFSSKLAAVARQAPGLAGTLVLNVGPDVAADAGAPADDAGPAPAVRRFDPPGLSARQAPGQADADSGLVEREPSAVARQRDLTGTVVLISGGGRGLGRLLATELAKAGAAVALLARSAAQLSAAVAEIEQAGGIAAAATADVTDRTSLVAAVDELTARLGPPDVLVNNAGIGGPVGPLWDTDPQEWIRTFDVNVTGAFELSRIVLRQMVAREHGRIINITSNAAVYRWPLLSAYAASKAALVKLSETLAVETGRYGVAVLSFDPGLLPIGLGESAAAGGTPDPGTPEGSVTTWIKERMASGRGADPALATRLLIRLAAGDGDRLSGRHLTVADDLDDVLANIDQVRRDDLHYLRLRIREHYN